MKRMGIDCKKQQVFIISQRLLTMLKERLIFMQVYLGLRLVKKTINFDRPEVYHLYFGNETGAPGTVITFFPWANQLKGRIGTGQVGVTGYIIPNGSMKFWQNRLEKFGVRIYFIPALWRKIFDILKIQMVLKLNS